MRFEVKISNVDLHMKPINLKFPHVIFARAKLHWRVEGDKFRHRMTVGGTGIKVGGRELTLI